MIAALFVETGGVYFDLPNVDPWDEARDARLYDGPWPVIAHPPCARWGRYWSGGPSAKVRRKLGDDDGCFESALQSVRRWGGVLEHPEASHAWAAFGIPKPPKDGGWIPLLNGGYTCCVEQGNYGHRTRKATWLLVYGITPPELKWGKSPATMRLDAGGHSTEERRMKQATNPVKRITAREMKATPVPFRDLLISIAEQATP